MQPIEPEAARLESTSDLNTIGNEQPFGYSPIATIDPDRPPWGMWSALLILILSIAFQIGAVIVLILPYALSRGLNVASPQFGEALAELARTDKTAIFLQVFSLLPAHLLTLGVIWCIVTGFGKRPFSKTVGLQPGGMRLWFSIVLGVVLVGLGTLIAKLVGGDATNQLEFVINSSIPTRYLIAFLAVATAPLVEELVYRGVIYSALRRAVGIFGAVVLVLALFTIIHVPQYLPNYGAILAVGLLSVVLTVIRAYTGSLLPCVVIHLVFNAVQAIILVVTAPAK